MYKWSQSDEGEVEMGGQELPCEETRDENDGNFSGEWSVRRKRA